MSLKYFSYVSTYVCKLLSIFPVHMINALLSYNTKNLNEIDIAALYVHIRFQPILKKKFAHSAKGAIFITDQLHFFHNWHSDF